MLGLSDGSCTAKSVRETSLHVEMLLVPHVSPALRASVRIATEELCFQRKCSRLEATTRSCVVAIERRKNKHTTLASYDMPNTLLRSVTCFDGTVVVSQNFSRYVARCMQHTCAPWPFIGYFPFFCTALRRKIYIGGEILIKYHDGAVYDGPYVSEACLDLKGTVPTGERCGFAGGYFSMR